MKILLPAIILSASVAFAQDSVDDFRWKDRLLVFSEGDQATLKKLAAEKADLAERDLKVYVLSGAGEEAHPVGEKLAEDFRERLAPPKSEPMAYLIGKDGRTTLKWKLRDFTFEKLYAAIDAMPMRRREMREGD
jgi:hypothetical protein